MATQQAQYLIATLNYRLKSTNFAFREDDLRSLLDQILAALAIDKSVALSPTVQFQIHESIRTDLLQRKNFVALEAYLIESLQQFQQKKLFSEKFYEKIFVLLNWIINASAINFNFEQSLHYTHLLHEELQKQNRKYYPKYVWVYHQSLVFNYSLLNRNADVIQLLNDIHKDPSLTGHSFYDVLSHLNLAVAYYNQNDLNNALKSLLPLLTSDAYNNLSPTMQLILGVVELILHCENKDFLYVESKIAELKRQFRSELNSKQYEREQSFLAILKMIAREAVPFQSKKTIEKCQEFIDKSPPFEPGSNEAINYKLWLQSKLTKQSYYQLVLKAVCR
ncbi:MAG: hypothetical protein IPL35_12210 [Sphingobacteriales bacterium]|nr:hypothetical protein [Sphingobacteriales bacterium]